MTFQNVPSSRMLNSYNRSCFRFTDNFLRITIPFASPIEKEMTGETSEMTVKIGVNDGENTAMTGKMTVMTGEIPRVKVETAGKTEKASGKTSEKILGLLAFDPFMTIAGMSGKRGVSFCSVERNLATLQQAELLKRVGGDKGGHWQVLEEKL